MNVVNAPSIFKVKVDDYHELSYIKEMIKTTLNISYNFVEVGCKGKYYNAVFYVGEEPTELIMQEKEKLNNKK